MFHNYPVKNSLLKGLDWRKSHNFLSSHNNKHDTSPRLGRHQFALFCRGITPQGMLVSPFGPFHSTVQTGELLHGGLLPIFVFFSFSLAVENHRPTRYNSVFFLSFLSFFKRERLNGGFQWKIWLLRLVRAVPSPFHVNRVISRLLFPTAFFSFPLERKASYLGISVLSEHCFPPPPSLKPYSLFMSVNTFSRKFSNDNSIYQQLYALVTV